MACVYWCAELGVMVAKPLTVAGGQKEKAECQTSFPTAGYTFLTIRRHTNEQGGLGESNSSKYC